MLVIYNDGYVISDKRPGNYSDSYRCFHAAPPSFFNLFNQIDNAVHDCVLAISTATLILSDLARMNNPLRHVAS